MSLHLSQDSKNNSSSSNNSSKNNPSRSRRKAKSYQCIDEYNDMKSALARMKETIGDETYIFRYTRKTIEGHKDFYNCHGNQGCPKTLYILRHSDSLKTSIWLAKDPHIH